MLRQLQYRKRSVGFNTVRADDVNSNTSVKERPLIYPSELQQLNSKGNMGNAIVTVFGYQPIRARFTPSYACKFYDMKMSEQELLTGRCFDEAAEAAAFYDMKARNAIANSSRRRNIGGGGTVREQIAERRRQASMTEKLQMIVTRSLQGFASEQETGDIFVQVQSREYDKAIKQLKQIKERAKGNSERVGAIQEAIVRLEEMKGCCAQIGNSEKMQLNSKILLTYAKENGMKIGVTFNSNSRMDSFVYKSLRLRAKYREFDVLLITELDVLGNSPIEITHEINFLNENGVKVVSVKDGELNSETLPLLFRKMFRLVK